MAVSLLEMHQIFMLAFAGLRVEGEVAQVLFVSQPPPLAFLVFPLNDWWEVGETPEPEPGKSCVWSESGKTFPTPANIITQPLIAPGTIWSVNSK